MTIVNRGTGLVPTHTEQTEHRTWEVNSLTFTELCRHEYTRNGCVFAAGSVQGHPVDTMYFSFEKDGEPITFLLLRPDELTAMAWVATGAVFSQQIDMLPEE